MKFTLYGPPLSMNKLERLGGRNPRARWAAKKRLRARLGREIRAAIGVPAFPVLEEKMRLRVHAYHETRRLDPDNVIGGLKVAIDAMRDVGLIWRDSEKWLVIDEPKQSIDRDNPRTVIEIGPFRLREKNIHGAGWQIPSAKAGDKSTGGESA